jgi:uncharacterized protein YlzI (FlbEa/FlbD family)
MDLKAILDINYLKENCTQIHSFGLGFIQIKLGEINRVHIYCKEAGLTTQEEEIHNHRYDFESMVLKGELENKIYQVEHNPAGLYQQINESCNPNVPKDIVPVIVNEPKMIAQFITSVGKKYFLNKDTFHRVQALEDTITVLTRGPVVKEQAQVVSRIDQELICPFSVNLPEDKLWELVREKIK